MAKVNPVPRKSMPSFSGATGTPKPAASKPPAILKPRYDKDQRTLWWGEQIIKRFYRAAPIAETILEAFEEEGWPWRIDDPLTPLRTNDEPSRLRNQIHALNQRLDKKLIRFYLDGTGEGICWEIVAAR